MFYPSLGQLKDSKEEQLVDQFDELLARLFDSGRTRVAPRFVARTLTVEFDVATEMVIGAEQAGVGALAYELMCPECGATYRAFDDALDAARAQHESGTCEMCEAVYESGLDEIWVSLIITEAPKKAPTPAASPGRSKQSQRQRHFKSF